MLGSEGRTFASATQIFYLSAVDDPFVGEVDDAQIHKLEVTAMMPGTDLDAMRRLDPAMASPLRIRSKNGRALRSLPRRTMPRRRNRPMRLTRRMRRSPDRAQGVREHEAKEHDLPLVRQGRA
jgi:hypothetical protein